MSAGNGTATRHAARVVPARKTPVYPEGEKGKSAGTLLLVDDLESLIEPLAELFRGKGYDVYTANNGADGLRLAMEVQPAITVLDVDMPPGANGLEVLRQIKERAIPTRVIMATGHAGVSEVVTYMREGACDYLVKPFRPEELAAAIKRAAIFQTTLDLEQRNPEVAKLIKRIKVLDANEARVAREWEKLRKAEHRLLFYVIAARALSLLVAVGVTLSLHWAQVIGAQGSLICAPILFVLLLLPLERVRKFRVKTAKAETEFEV